MIENTAWAAILASATDFSTVCEIYEADATPAANGFDPDDAIDCFAAATGVSFMGVDYKQLIKNFGRINRRISKESNTASVDFSNVSREIASFEFNHGFEGLIMVIRLISRSQSVDQDTSQILFTGRCEKPKSGNKTTLSVTATWILGGLEIQIPRRKFSPDDQEGRVPTDPNFEGFLFMPQEGSLSYSTREKRGGIAGLLGFKKTVRHTLQYSSHSDIDANRPVPEIFGRAQIKGIHIAYIDVGAELRMRTAFSEGPIEDIQNPRSVQSLLAILGDYGVAYGVEGAGNEIFPALPLTEWVGQGIYSRTALIIAHTNPGSEITVDDPAPDIVAVILGRLMTIPDGSGDWVLDGEWTDDGAAHTRFVLCSPDYFNLDANWIHEPDFTECYLFNNERIIDRSLSDFLFINPA